MVRGEELEWAERCADAEIRELEHTANTDNMYKGETFTMCDWVQRITKLWWSLWREITLLSIK